MDENKVTQEELDKLLSIRQRSDDLAYQFGKFEFAIITLQKQQQLVKAAFENLAQEELSVLEEIREKYGDGEIDLETGEIFTQSE